MSCSGRWGCSKRDVEPSGGLSLVSPASPANPHCPPGRARGLCRHSIFPVLLRRDTLFSKPKSAEAANRRPAS